MDPALRRPGRLDKEIEIGVPDEKGREQILSVLLSEVPHLLSANDIAKVASQAHGFVGADLHLLVKVRISDYHCTSELGLGEGRYFFCRPPTSK